MGEQKRKHELGDAPIEPEYIEKMNALARAIDELFNGETKGPTCCLIIQGRLVVKLSIVDLLAVE